MSDVVELYERLPTGDPSGWWRTLAADAPGGNVLYGGCGTGRVALPLAAATERLVAVESDPEMVAAFRTRLDADPGLGPRVELVESPFHEIDLEERFGLVVLPSNLINGITDPARRTAAVRAAARHCRADGRVILQVLNPFWLAALDREVVGDLDPADGSSVHVIVAPRGFDAWEQRAQATITYRFPDGRELIDELDAIALFPRELRALAYQGGLDLLGSWGDRPGVDPLGTAGGSWHLVTMPRVR